MAGAVVSALRAVPGAAWAFFGAGVMAAHWDSVRAGEISHLLGAKVFQMHSINAFLGLLLPWPRGVLHFIWSARLPSSRRRVTCGA